VSKWRSLTRLRRTSNLPPVPPVVIPFTGVPGVKQGVCEAEGRIDPKRRLSADEASIEGGDGFQVVGCQGRGQPPAGCGEAIGPLMRLFRQFLELH
jgi:hypothetical protein